MEIRYSKKLFYTNWAYKIRLRMPTGYNQYIKVLLSYARESTVQKKVKSLMKDIRNPNSSGHQWLWEHGTGDQLQEMYDWIFWARANKLLQVGRINEYWRIITYYTNDYNLIKDMADKFPNIVEYIEQPANNDELDILKNKRNTTIVNRLPYNKYRYSCDVGYYNDDGVCERFLRWSEPFGKRIKISARWGNYGDRNFRKFWVQDKKLLHMVQLFMGKNIRHVESFVLRRDLPSAQQKDLFDEK
jgi:hypothetical protein|tara:strand:- start:1394 stop:2125 length:732 start_codon:yes stop_codon:yes gene_type:complete